MKEKYLLIIMHLTRFLIPASENMICSGALKKLKNINVVPGAKEYRYSDGGCNKTIGMYKLDFEYDKRTYSETFNVVDNNKRKIILLCNTFVKKIEDGVKEIPIKCSIKTRDAPPVNWTRPIRSRLDKEEFEKLLDEM